MGPGEKLLVVIGAIACIIAAIIFVMVVVDKLWSALYDLNYKYGKEKAFRRGWYAAHRYYHDGKGSHFPASPPYEVEKEYL